MLGPPCYGGIALERKSFESGKMEVSVVDFNKCIGF